MSPPTHWHAAVVTLATLLQCCSIACHDIIISEFGCCIGFAVQCCSDEIASVSRNPIGGLCCDQRCRAKRTFPSGSRSSTNQAHRRYHQRVRLDVVWSLHTLHNIHICMATLCPWQHKVVVSMRVDKSLHSPEKSSARSCSHVLCTCSMQGEKEQNLPPTSCQKHGQGLMVKWFNGSGERVNGREVKGLMG